MHRRKAITYVRKLFPKFDSWNESLSVFRNAEKRESKRLQQAAADKKLPSLPMQVPVEQPTVDHLPNANEHVVNAPNSQDQHLENVAVRLPAEPDRRDYHREDSVHPHLTPNDRGQRWRPGASIRQPRADVDDEVRLQGGFTYTRRNFLHGSQVDERRLDVLPPFVDYELISMVLNSM